MKKIKINKQGQCPLCKDEGLDYGAIEPSDSGVFYPWKCTNKKCGATGKEFYNIEFDSHGQVKDKNGNEIRNNAGY